jgi:hypothetical protein
MTTFSLNLTNCTIVMPQSHDYCCSSNLTEMKQMNIITPITLIAVTCIYTHSISHTPVTCVITLVHTKGGIIDLCRCWLQAICYSICHYSKIFKCICFRFTWIHTYLFVLLYIVSTVHFTERSSYTKVNGDFTFFEPCIMIYICKKNQQNAHFFHECFNSIILSLTCFEHLNVHYQEVCTSNFMVFCHASI